MLMLNDAQALIVESLLTQMLINDAYSVAHWKKRSAGFIKDERFHVPLSKPGAKIWLMKLSGNCDRNFEKRVQIFKAIRAQLSESAKLKLMIQDHLRRWGDESIVRAGFTTD